MIPRVSSNLCDHVQCVFIERMHVILSLAQRRIHCQVSHHPSIFQTPLGGQTGEHFGSGLPLHLPTDSRCHPFGHLRQSGLTFFNKQKSEKRETELHLFSMEGEIVTRWFPPFSDWTVDTGAGRPHRHPERPNRHGGYGHRGLCLQQGCRRCLPQDCQLQFSLCHLPFVACVPFCNLCSNADTPSSLWPAHEGNVKQRNAEFWKIENALAQSLCGISPPAKEGDDHVLAKYFFWKYHRFQKKK